MDENKNTTNTAEELKEQPATADACGQPDCTNKESQEHGCCDQTQEGCCCGSCSAENKGPSKHDDQPSFMSELNDLVQKYGGTVIGHGVHAMDEGPITPSGLPLCLNAATCDHASECPYGHPVEEGEETPSDEFSILLSALESITKRLDKIEEAVQPVELRDCTGEVCIGEFKKPRVKLRKKDMRRLRKSIVGELKPYIRKISDRQTEELKRFIGQSEAGLKGFINRTNSVHAPRMLQMGRTADPGTIDLPKKGWTLDDWIKFQSDLSQKILSSKMDGKR